MPRPNKRRRSGSPGSSSRSPRRKKLTKNAFLIALSCLSLLGLITGLFFLQKEKEKSRSRASVSEKAQRLNAENPQAEALDKTEDFRHPDPTPVSPPKKQTILPTSPPTSLPAPSPSPVPTAAPTPVPEPTPSPIPEHPVESMPHPTPPPSNEPPRRAEQVIAPAPATELDVAAWQVQLERHHFSSGTIDGDLGMRSKRALIQFQRNRNLPITGELDFESRLALGTPGNPFKNYLITQEDMGMIQPTPQLWADKAKATYLGYNDSWEMLSEKFHTSPDFLKKLNPGVSSPSAGVEITAPNLDQSFPVPHADKIQIILHETTLLVTSNSGRVLACFPCSIAADKNKRPNGVLAVKVVAPNPNYTFNPEVLTVLAKKEGLTTKMILPPGPNNPVGLAWIGLTLPGYGIHGTPEPMDISRTGSSGCFRLANWNAQKLMKMVSIGTPVEVLE
jgi:lipoprotein-anchoring transpeptidase ErfK/SrfK